MIACQKGLTKTSSKHRNIELRLSTTYRLEVTGCTRLKCDLDEAAQKCEESNSISKNAKTCKFFDRPHLSPILNWCTLLLLNGKS